LPDDFRVGIVGAGPAGCCCAQVLGEAGIRVALFDHSHPREKPCGGLIENRVVEEFNIPNKLLENRIDWCSAERFRLRAKLFFKPPMFLVSRKDFDFYLLQRTLENKSVAFFDEKVTNVMKEGKGWTLKTNKDRRVKVNSLVGADGSPSFIRRHVCHSIPSQFVFLTVGYNFPCSNDYIEGNFARNTIEAYYPRKYVKKGGYLWIFPKRNSINVGIGGVEAGRKLRHSLEEFIYSHPAGKRLKHLEGHLYAHTVPIIWMDDFYNLPCAGDDWALIGDAAGHVDPVTGAGIYYAMKGGTLCGSALLDGDIHLFEKYWREDYGDELIYGAKIVLKFYGSPGFLLWLRYVFENYWGRFFSW
jgi:geranylgeranyl reductase family protein